MTSSRRRITPSRSAQGHCSTSSTPNTRIAASATTAPARIWCARPALTPSISANALDDIRFAAGCEVQTVLALEDEIVSALNRYYRDEWLLPERERLRQRFMAALERLIELLEQKRDYALAIRYAHRTVNTF